MDHFDSSNATEEKMNLFSWTLISDCDGDFKPSPKEFFVGAFCQMVIVVDSLENSAIKAVQMIDKILKENALSIKR